MRRRDRTEDGPPIAGLRPDGGPSASGAVGGGLGGVQVSASEVGGETQRQVSRTLTGTGRDLRDVHLSGAEAALRVDQCSCRSASAVAQRCHGLELSDFPERQECLAAAAFQPNCVNLRLECCIYIRTVIPLEHGR